MLNRRHAIRFGIGALGAVCDVARSTAANTGGSTTGGNTSTNAYPLAMPSGITGNAPVQMGNGPDIIVAALSYADKQANAPQFAILMDGVVIAAPLTLSTQTGPGQQNPQVWTIKGAWGPGPHTIRFQGITGTLNDMSFIVVTYNYQPFVTNTTTDSRNTRNVNASQTWVSNGAPTVDFTPPINQPASGSSGATSSNATPTDIAGAAINGTPAAAGPLDKLIAATPAHGTLMLPAGTILGTAAVLNAITITGTGAGKTVMTCAGLEPTADKAILVPHVDGVKVSGLTLRGAQISADLGNNAAGIRDSGTSGASYTLTGVEITGNQDGILTNAGNWTLSNCTVHANGAGDGLTHELYFNDDNASNVVRLTSCTVTQGLKSTHAVKSRAGTTHIVGGTYATGGNPDDQISGTLLDFPNGGIVNISGAKLIVKPSSAVFGFLGYAMEGTGAANSAVGTTVTLTNCVLTDQTGTGGYIANGTTVPNARLVLSGCTYTGSVPPKITGFGTVIGAITAASR
jgi:hypothetical protein